MKRVVQPLAMAGAYLIVTVGADATEFAVVV